MSAFEDLPAPEIGRARYNFTTLNSHCAALVTKRERFVIRVFHIENTLSVRMQQA
jgi:hypothetical protein